MAALWSKGSSVKHVFNNWARNLSRSQQYLDISWHRLCSSRPTIHAWPRSGLADESLDIRATGLTPGQSVVLQGEVDTECGRYRFTSRAKYTADKCGQVTGQLT